MSDSAHVPFNTAAFLGSHMLTQISQGRPGLDSGSIPAYTQLIP